LGGYKRPPRPSSTVGHSFHIANTLRLSLQVLIHSYSYLKALPQKCLEEKVSHGYSSQNSFLRNSHPFVGFTPYWILIPWFFKPVKLHVYP
jgi:hypothetical protein